MSFIPKGYEVPKSNSNYFNVSKVENGKDNIIRILSKPIMGWLDWLDKKPVRTPYSENKPEANDPLKPVRHFWAMVVWDYQEGNLKVMEITQATIQDALYTLDCDSAWGEPTQYDINIKKEGKDLTTKYFVTPRPPKPVDQLILDTFNEINPDLNELFTNGDPFAKKAQTTSEKVINIDEIGSPASDFSKIPF